MADGQGGEFRQNDDAYTYPDAGCTSDTMIRPMMHTRTTLQRRSSVLKEAGYEFVDDGNGNQVLSDETPLNVTYITNDGTAHVAIAEAIQQDFAVIGAQLKIETNEWNVFLNERKAGNYDMSRNGWLADFNDPINMLEMWTTDSGNNDVQFGR